MRKICAMRYQRSGKSADSRVPKLAADISILFEDWAEFYAADPDLAGFRFQHSEFDGSWHAWAARCN
jgi:hypothetical protein